MSRAVIETRTAVGGPLIAIAQPVQWLQRSGVSASTIRTTAADDAVRILRPVPPATFNLDPGQLSSCGRLSRNKRQRTNFLHN